MKISVITACFNCEKTIEKTIQSVLAQTACSVEYIIIDGGSTDGTRSIIEKYREFIAHFISEKDDGLYSAINKGIELASGDILGLLHGDDVYRDHLVLAQVCNVFSENSCDATYSDVIYKDKYLEKVVRRYNSRLFKPSMFAYGMMPAHTSLFVKKLVFSTIGKYDESYKIGADFDFYIRLFSIPRFKIIYSPDTWVTMRVGGKSRFSVGNLILINSEILRACAYNGVKTNIVRILCRYVFKVRELITIS